MLTGYASLTRIGRVRRTVQRAECNYSYAHPAMVPLIGIGNFVLRAPAASREQAATRLIAPTSRGPDGCTAWRPRC